MDDELRIESLAIENEIWQGIRNVIVGGIDAEGEAPDPLMDPEVNPKSLNKKLICSMKWQGIMSELEQEDRNEKTRAVEDEGGRRELEKED